MPRITDILTQLLQQEDPAELAIVRNGLELLIKKDPKGILQFWEVFDPPFTFDPPFLVSSPLKNFLTPPF